MPAYAPSSLVKLMTLVSPLRAVMRELVLVTDITIIYALRGKEAQDEAYRNGFSRARWPDSAHNAPIAARNVPREHWPEDPNGLSRAVDFAPYPVDWKDERQFAYVAGRAMEIGRRLGIKLVWGGDWNGDGQGVWRDPKEKGALVDLGHIEIPDDTDPTLDIPTPRIAVAPGNTRGRSS